MMMLIHKMVRKSRMARRYWSEDGLYLFLCKTIENAIYGIRDWLISRKAKSPPLRLGRSPRLIGLNRIKFGRNFGAGRDLWIQAVTQHEGTIFSPQIVIGDNVSVSDNVHIGATSSVCIGDCVLIGSRVIITDHNHGVYSGDFQSSPEVAPSSRRLSADRDVVVGNNVWIGDGVAILAGAEIGSGSIIGANSVVTGYIPPNCIAAGAPAVPIRFYEEKSKKWLRGNSSK